MHQHTNIPIELGSIYRPTLCCSASMEANALVYDNICEYSCRPWLANKKVVYINWLGDGTLKIGSMLLSLITFMEARCLSIL